MQKKLIIALVILLMASWASGCDSIEPSGCLDQALLQEPSMLNPLLLREDCSVTDYIFQGLVRFDEHLQLVGQLAESWEVSPDNREWTFSLRQDVSWHDGKPFTTADVEFTFALHVFDGNFPGPRDKDLAAIEAIEVLDDYRIKFILAPGHELSMAKMSLPILPRHLYDPQLALGGDKLPTGQMAKHPRNWRPVGTGPYCFGEWQNQGIILHRNEEYYDGDGPYIQTIKFNFYPDLDTALSDLAAGRVDLLGDLSPAQMEAVPDLSHTHEYYTYQEMGCQVLAFNFHGEAVPWRDRRVRQAVAFAIDREKMISELLGGRGVPMEGMIPSKSWAYAPAIADYPQDLAQAGQLLDAAGWLPDQGGWRCREGQRLTLKLTFREDHSIYWDMAALIQQDLARVGIDVHPDPRPWNNLLLDCMQAGNFDLLLLGLSLDPDPSVALFSSKSISRGMNVGGYTSSTLESLLGIDVMAADLASRQRAYGDMQELMSQDLPYIFLFSPLRTAIADKDLRGIVPSPLGLQGQERWRLVGDDENTQGEPLRNEH